MSTSKELPTHPLTGIRVVEVGIYMAGPFCAMQLADLGADVIKVENPDGGDIARDSAPFLDGESSPFIRLNRNKRSLAMNLKAPEGKEVFRELVRGADVVVENLRPGTMGDLELDYGHLAALNPGLVYIAASGWGQTGPYSQLAGLDIMAQAMSGLISITGEPNGDPVKVGVPICDLVCALYGTIGALAALRVRELTGRGQFIDVSLFEAGVSLAVWEAGRFFATGEIPGPLGSAHQTAAPYQAIRAADGFFTVGATTPRNWRSFCDALDHPEWASEERFKDNPSRHARRDVLIPMIEQVTSRKPRAHWVSLLQEAGVPCAEILTYDQVFNDPQLQARDFFWKGLHSKLGEVEQIGSPIHFSDTPARRGRAGPVLGEHTSEVLRALGRTDAEIVDLKAKGVLGGI
ncbi:MAG: CoA transferase [Chloroflexi bacterium]|nr:MAG: CoA transferase [Chloroflexota bacterium]